MSKDNWWRKFKKVESRKLKFPKGDEQKFLEIGQSVRLVGKPEKLRKVIKIEWHYHRYEYVYIVETSAIGQGRNFEPYWFLSQFEGYQEEKSRQNMKILISGASGLVGTHLIPTLKAKGHEIYRLVRKTPRTPDEIGWDAQKGFSDTEQGKLENFDAVIHLAGDSIAAENWSEEKKRRIRESRAVGTRVLVDALKQMQNPPKIFISASASGFYGDRKDEILTEESGKGTGFIPDICDEWETEARKAEGFGARVVTPRIGVVLSKDGGALDKMLTPFKLGVGGVVGSGKQWMPWISLDDLISVIHFALENEDLKGPVNTVSPQAVTNEEFTKTFGKVLHRPTILPIPEFAIKLLYGEMGETLLLQGQRMEPKVLQEAGFEFQFPNLEDALKHALN